MFVEHRYEHICVTLNGGRHLVATKVNKVHAYSGMYMEVCKVIT